MRRGDRRGTGLQTRESGRLGQIDVGSGERPNSVQLMRSLLRTVPRPEPNPAQELLRRFLLFRRLLTVFRRKSSDSAQKTVVASPIITLFFRFASSQFRAAT